MDYDAGFDAGESGFDGRRGGDGAGVVGGAWMKVGSGRAREDVHGWIGGMGEER